MSPQRQTKVPHRALIALSLVPTLVFLAAIPWLKEQPDWLVFLLAGISSVLAIVAGFSHSVLTDRNSDEWHRSGARFASQWGWLTGLSIVALLLALPPFHGLVHSVVSWAATDLARAPAPDREVALLAFVLGFFAVIFAQVICTIALSIGWFSWMSRQARDPQ